MSMIGPQGLRNRCTYRDELCKGDESKKKEILKAITYHSTGFIRAIQNRKKFVQNHSEKLRLAEEIIKHRPNTKIITFSANTKMAESFSSGFVYTGKEGKKKNGETNERYSFLGCTNYTQDGRGCNRMMTYKQYRSLMNSNNQ